MFSREGSPDEMLTNCGFHFTADVIKEVSRLISLQQLTTTSYHPMCNGVVERFHASISKCCVECVQNVPKIGINISQLYFLP